MTGRSTWKPEWLGWGSQGQPGNDGVGGVGGEQTMQVFGEQIGILCPVKKKWEGKGRNK